jgi:hypothetical protein
MKKKFRNILKRVFLLGMSANLAASALLFALPVTLTGSALASTTFTDEFSLTKLALYQAGSPNADGGVAEIVAFNKENNKFYLVNGASNPPSMDIVTLGTSGNLTKDTSVMVKTIVETNGFVFGDLTSIDVNNAIDRIFVSVQAAGAAHNGKIVEFDYAGNLIAEYATGAQPDMIISTADGKYVLTANEGEPRVSGVDPQGSITILNTVTDTVQNLLFDNPAIIDDAVHIRGASHPTTGLVTSKGTKADAIFDLEPEYITISADGSKAFVSLQENNAIATVDLLNSAIISVKGLGLKDHSLSQNSLDMARDSSIKIENAPFYGIYNPDGIANMTVGNKTYIFSANEGDATDFPGRKNFSSISTLKNSLTAGSAAANFLSGKSAYNNVEVAADWGNDTIYLYGARSFSIWDADNMSQVYDSANEFERITAERIPAFFNSNHATTVFDNRSARKGPEPEAIELGKIGDRTFAFIGLERIGGVMVYDVTNPAAPVFVNYTNTRVFTPKDNLNTETGPEGLDFIPGSVSPTGWPLLLIANEVSGNVAIMQINLHDDQQAPTVPTNVSASNVSDNGFTLNWQESTDNVGVTKYEIYNGSTLLGSSVTNSFTASDLTAGTEYSISVKACDAGLNCSAATSVKSVKTTDSVAPTAPESLRIVKVTGNAINVAWNAATDNIAVDGYRVFVNGSPRTTVKGTVANIKNLSPNTQYTITVRAFDQQKNNSANGTALIVTTGATAGTIVDVDAPTRPVNLVSENVSMFGFALKWAAASDNVGVKEYEVYRNGKLHGKTAHPTFHFRNMAPGRNSNVQVIAVDHAGNKSTISDSIDVMTLLGNALLDINAPQTPSNLSASDVTSSGFKVSWTASEDDVFTFGYNVYLNGVYVASVGGTSYTFSGLSMTAAHSVQILAYDMAKNRSAKSTSLSVVNP